MKNIKFLFPILLFISLSYSCDQKEKSTDPETDETNLADSTNNDPFMQFSNTKKMEEINDRINPKNRVESLRWEKQTDHGSEFTTVTTYVDDDGFPMKIVEHFIDGNFRPEGEREYYLEDNELIYFQEMKDVWIDSNYTQYVETKTVFDKNSPAMTLTRSGEYENIQDATWEEMPSKNPSMEKVNNILGGTGKFQTHFISVIKGDHLFLLLGENKEDTKDRYTTALRVDEISPFIQDLLNHLKDYKFRPVEIKFNVEGGENQPEFRVLTDIHWKEGKNN